MQTYPQRVRDSILPLSLAGSLPQAFREWRFTGRYEDHEAPIETCELCGQEQLRYHFEIGNRHTHHTMQVGSHCILRFEVAVYDERDRQLTAAEAKTRLSHIQQQMRLSSCLRALERVAQAEDNRVLSGALDYYRKNKCLTPKQAFVVFWRLTENRIDHDPGFFKIALKRGQHKDDLSSMPTDRVHYLWKALTPAQRKIAREMGHDLPHKKSDIR